MKTECVMPAELTAGMREVIENARCVFSSADALYKALLAAAPKPPAVEAQEQPAPIPTSERLPTKGDADCRLDVWAKRGGIWKLMPFDFVSPDYDECWLPTGLTRPQNPEAGHD